MKAFKFLVMGICLIALGLYLGWLSYQHIAQGFSVSRDGKVVTKSEDSPMAYWLVRAAHTVVVLLIMRNGWMLCSKLLKNNQPQIMQVYDAPP